LQILGPPLPWTRAVGCSTRMGAEALGPPTRHARKWHRTRATGTGQCHTDCAHASTTTGALPPAIPHRVHAPCKQAAGCRTGWLACSLQRGDDVSGAAGLGRQVDGGELRGDLRAHLDGWVLVLGALDVSEVAEGLQRDVGREVGKARGGDAPQGLASGLGGLDGGQRRVVDHHLRARDEGRGATGGVEKEKGGEGLPVATAAWCLTSWKPARTCPPVMYSSCLPAWTSRHPALQWLHQDTTDRRRRGVHGHHDAGTAHPSSPPSPSIHHGALTGS